MRRIWVGVGTWASHRVMASGDWGGLHGGGCGGISLHSAAGPRKLNRGTQPGMRDRQHTDVLF